MAPRQPRRGQRKPGSGPRAAAAIAPPGTAPVDRAALAPSNSYGVPDFVERGHYVDEPFRCVDCGRDEVWRATQQKWWFEVAKGFVYARAVRCRACRRRVQGARAEARAVSAAGRARKAARRGG